MPGLHTLRATCVRDRDRETLLSLAQLVLDWVHQAASSVTAQGYLEIAELLAEDLGHSETPARLYERAIALSPSDFNVTDRARRVLEGGELDHRVEWLFVLQARTLDELRRIEPAIRRTAWRRLAELRMSRGALDGAIAALDIAIQIEPRAEDIHTLASLLEQRGTKEDTLEAAELYLLLAELAPETQQVRYLERSLLLNPEQKVAKATLTVLSSPRPREQDVSEGVSVVIPLMPPIVGSMEPPRISQVGAHSASIPRKPLRLRHRHALLAAAMVLGAALVIILHSSMAIPSPGTKAMVMRSSDRQAASAAIEPSDPDESAGKVTTPPVHRDTLLSTANVAASAAAPLQASQGAPVATNEAASVGELGFVAHVRSVQGGRMRAGSLKRALTRTSEGADSCLAEKAPAAARNLELSFTWLVNRAGRVSWVRHKNRRHAVATRCVSKALEAARFPRPKGGAVRIEGTWSLSPHEPR